MTYIGIDYSITSPAICVYEGEARDFAFDSCQLYSLTDRNDLISKGNLHFSQHKEFAHDTERFFQIASWALECIDNHEDDGYAIGIEGYSMGSKGLIFNIAENTGSLKYQLWSSGMEFDTIPPTTIKKFATGKGNAKKEQMVEQFLSDTGIDLKKRLQPNRKLGSPTTDLVDAFYICKYVVETTSSKSQ